MKKLSTILIGMVVGLGVLCAQVPTSFSYQAVATDADGDELTEQNIGLQFSIRSASPDGDEVYRETHTEETDRFGLFTVEIGRGTVAVGDLSQINWSDGLYFLRVEMDISGGSNYVFMGANQLLSVPYAMHSQRSDQANSAQTAEQAATATFADSAAVANTAQQSVFAQNATQADFAQQANTATYADTAAYSDTTSYAEMSMTAMNAINATNAINAQNALFAQAAATAIDDEDRNPENELQELSLSGDLITISGGNSVNFLAENVYNAPAASL
ncbi:MAG: hypothetical protein AAF840_10375, partial [Bacteroidota bacterium]